MPMPREPFSDLVLWEQSRRRGDREATPEELCGDYAELLDRIRDRVEQLGGTQRVRPDPGRAPSILLSGINGAFRGRSWSFSSHVRIGRLGSSDLVLDDSPEATVSRIHARIWHDQGGWWLADLGSTNGTRWNGEKVGREAAGPLLPLHLVQLGNVCLRVESVTAPASPEP